MGRGDLILVALPGAYGKPRPALIVQSDLFIDAPSVTVLPLTSDLTGPPGPRVELAPSAASGLRRPSRVMVDKAHTLPRDRTGPRIGRLSAEDMTAVDRALALFLGFA